MEEDAVSGTCDLGHDLYQAGLIYWVFNLIAIIFMITYMVAMIAMITGKDSGFCGMNYFQPTVWTLSTIAGFAVWWGLSEAAFDNDCEKDDFEPDEKVDICAESGMTVPILAFVFNVAAGICAFVNTKV
jgi:hypothetical protein